MDVGCYVHKNTVWKETGLFTWATQEGGDRGRGRRRLEPEVEEREGRGWEDTGEANTGHVRRHGYPFIHMYDSMNAFKH